MSEIDSLDDVVATGASRAVGLYAGQTLPDNYTTLIEDGYQRDDSNPTTTTITCLSMALTQALLPANKNLVVYGDVITIASALSLPGRNITIYARQVVSNGGSIDLTAAAIPAGSPGNYVAGVRAKDGDPGANRGDDGKRGDDGAHGAKGGTGGDLKIYAESLFGALKVTCNGGPAGRGQDAGNGGDGQTGKDGNDAVIEGGQQQSIMQNPTPGANGARGGDGANGGNGGEGGRGGQFQATITRKIGTVDVTLMGGEGGAAGGFGTGGKAGAGGVGGRFAECKNIGRGMDSMRQCNHISTRAESGREGMRGGSGLHGQPGRGGLPTSQVIISGPTVEEQFRSKVPQTYNAMVLRQAEMNYMNGDYLIASNLLEWLRLLGREGAGRAETLLTQLHQGLNYFGRPANHVPLVALEYYQRQLTSLLLLGQNIENARDTYNNRQSTQDAMFKALDTAIAESKSLQTKLKDSLIQLGTQETQLQEEILQLVTARSRQRDVMLAAAEAFKKAVEQKALGCSFDDLLKFAMTVASVGKAAYGDFTAISGAIGGLKSVTATLDGLQGAIKQIAIGGKSVADLATQWGTIKKTLSPTAPDVSKIVAEQEAFDAMIKPYLEMPEAAAYKKHVHDFIGIVQAVNKKLFDYNSVAVSRFGLTAQIALKETEGADIVNRRAQAADPTLQHFRTFMEVAYEDARKQIMRHLYEENCAYRYWRLAEKPFVVKDRTIGGLTTVHVKLASEILDMLNDSTTPLQKFPPNKVVTLAEATRPEQFEGFRRGYANEKNETVHDLTFTLVLDGDTFPMGWAQVLVTNFTIALPNARTKDGSIDVRLIHSGQVVIRDQKGALMEFSHVSRLADYSYDIATGTRLGGGNLGGDDDNKQYIGLSPYSTWTIRIKADHNPGLDLSAVKEIKLTFAGKYYPTLRGAPLQGAEASPALESEGEPQ